MRNCLSYAMHSGRPVSGNGHLVFFLGVRGTSRKAKNENNQCSPNVIIFCNTPHYASSMKELIIATVSKKGLRVAPSISTASHRLDWMTSRLLQTLALCSIRCMLHIFALCFVGLARSPKTFAS